MNIGLGDYMLLSDYKKSYLAQCHLKELSAETIKTYDKHINYFIKHTSDIEVCLLCQEIIESYIIFVNQSALAAMSKRSYLREVKMFLHYIDKHEKTNYANFVTLPRKHKKLVHILSSDEIGKIYCNLNTFRDKLIFALAYDCGLRRIEISRLKLNDVFKGFFKILGKGNKERLVPYGNLTADLLNNYLRYEHDGENEYLILTRYGKPFTVDGLSNFFRKLSIISGIDLSAHRLRHNFATNYLINQIEHGSSDLFQLQLLLGHADPEVTKYYLHLAHEQLIIKNSFSQMDFLVQKKGINI